MSLEEHRNRTLAQLQSLSLKTVPYASAEPRRIPLDDSKYTSKLRKKLKKRPVSAYEHSSTTSSLICPSSTHHPLLDDARVKSEGHLNRGSIGNLCSSKNINASNSSSIRQERRRSMSFLWKSSNRKDVAVEREISPSTKSTWYIPTFSRTKRDKETAYGKIAPLRLQDCPDSPFSSQSRDSAYYSASVTSSKGSDGDRTAPNKWSMALSSTTSSPPTAAPIYELPSLDLPTLSPICLSPLQKTAPSPCPSSVYPSKTPPPEYETRTPSIAKSVGYILAEVPSLDSEILANEYIGLIARETSTPSLEDRQAPLEHLRSPGSSRTKDRPLCSHAPHDLSTIQGAARYRRVLRHKASSRSLRRESIVAVPKPLIYNAQAEENDHGRPSTSICNTKEYYKNTNTLPQLVTKVPTPPPRSVLRCNESFRRLRHTKPCTMVPSHRPKSQDSRIQVLIDAFESLQLELEGNGREALNMEQVRDLGIVYGRVGELLARKGV